MSAETKLPDLPSALIRVALADLAKVEAMPDKYVIRMGDWHFPDVSVCAVCLAGSVMAMTLGHSPDQDLTPGDLPEYAKLVALNEFRLGLIDDALGAMGIDSGGTLWADRGVTPHRQDPAAFRADMEQLASDLEAAGL